MTPDKKKRPDDVAQATIVGFSRINCKKCFGRGYLGFDARYRDHLHVIPCSCSEFMEIEAVRKIQKEQETAVQEKEKANDAVPETVPEMQAH